ncbi:solute carrier family 15 member 1-like isoform X1 [Clavelina lepadiformis]|uniref:solute carrier family 15 member 1-like isoform X1 n=2 Tax=Clavelina lepadiformis TaxID=159417 RepID=UPI0040435F99
MELEKVDDASDTRKLNEDAHKNGEVKVHKSGYPKHVFFIIGNEFCERFSFYGMRTVLVLYARNYLRFDDDSATSIFHAFTMLAYFMPIFGGIIADSYWGKYKTIALLSIFYVIGHGVKTLAAIPYIPSRGAHIGLSMLGLFLIAVGTGGIKPCVSTFGGDQFTLDQTHYRSQFFAMFYFSINCGALISKWLTPMFRADLDCYPGEEGPEFQECFSVAFGVPGALMLLAVVLFFAGSKFYTRVQPEGSVFWKFCKCVYSACKNRWLARKANSVQKEHWIDYADAPKRLKRDTKYVLRVLYLFIPLPFFWALFDQQGSRWTLQALQLDGYWGSYQVKPDQIDVINPLLIVTLIPLFEATLYPLLRHCKINFSPIRRMAVGLVLAGVSFICAAILQFNIDAGMTSVPAPNQFAIRLINVGPCDVNLESSSEVFNGLVIGSNDVSDTKSNFFPGNTSVSLNISSCGGSFLHQLDIARDDGVVADVIIGGNGSSLYSSIMPTRKLENGKSIFTFINVDASRELALNSSIFMFDLKPGHRSSEIEIDKGFTSYGVYINDSSRGQRLVYNGTVESLPGGVYSVILNSQSSGLGAVEFAPGRRQLDDINPNTINIAWMIPQFFVLTVGEVFLSVTGLEFSYTQAPPTMKSVVSSFWLLLVSLGSVIVLLIAKTHAIDRQAHEFLLFAGLIGVAALIFVFLARGYKMVDENEFRSSEDEEKDTDERTSLAA